MISSNNTKPLRYNSLSILLHWTVVLGLIFMLASGLYMVNADISKADQYKLFQLHKAAGVVMLWTLFVRIGVRIFTTAPDLPSSLSIADKKKAQVGHMMLYLALVIMPLSGWVMVSASPFGLPTFVFVDWIKWPHIPGVARNKTIETIANNTHWITAAVLLTLIIGHVAAIIRHKKVHSLNLLHRMWWSKRKS